MSRSGYSDDCDDDLADGRWIAQVKSSIRGKRGQKLFADLARALDEMPVRELISNSLETADGSFCTLGVLGASRGVNMKEIDPNDIDLIATAFDVTEQLAREIVYQNDEVGGSYQAQEDGTYKWTEESSAERWIRMRAWIKSQIKVDRPQRRVGEK